VPDPIDLAKDPAIDVFVELIGGESGVAKEAVEAALAAGKHVVTANKALLAQHGQDLFRRAAERRRSISFEAGVCGGIPIIHAIRDGYVAGDITQIVGIVNGTCNYILTQMAREGASYSDALRRAQEQGFAESNPSLDVEGTDSAHKLAILARLAFAEEIDFASIHTEGITRIEPIDIQFGAEMGYVLKLLAIAKQIEDRLELRVHPAFLLRDHPLASVAGVFNAVWIRGEATGDTMHYGRGAGQMPTAAAVVTDLIDVSLGRAAISAAAFRALSGDLPRAVIRDSTAIESRYYLRFSVVDRPGVLSAISGVLGRHAISIASARQPEQSPDRDVPIVMVTHLARERDTIAALHQIDSLDVVKRRTQLIRIER